MSEQTAPIVRLRDDLLLAALYFAQALPMGFAWLGLPPWLRSHDIGLEAIGLTALSALPWAFKFTWAAWVERLSVRYSCRNVILVTQSLAVLFIIGLVGIDFVARLPMGIALLLLLNTLCATQDIATERFAILRRGAAGAARVNVARYTGFTAGMLVAGGGLLLITTWWNWPVFVLSWAVVMALITLAVSHLNEAGLPQPQSPDRIGLRRFLRRPMAWNLLAIALVFKTSHALSDGMLKSFWVDKGVTLEQISMLITLNIALAGFIGAPLGAWLIARHNRQQDKATAIPATRNVAVWFGLSSAVILVLLGLAIDSGIGIVRLPEWDLLYIGLPALLALIDGAASLAFFTLFMRWSVGAQPGTTFTLFICAESLGGVILAAIAGTVAAYLGYAVHFILTAVLTLLAMSYAWRTINRYTRTQHEPSHEEVEHVVA